jgi:dTDP-4-amino-4,6-dideoxygalactose transaminase
MFRYEATSFGGPARDDFVRALQAEGIPCSGGYRPIHLETAIRASVVALQEELHRPTSVSAQSLPEAERASTEGVWLPQNLLLDTIDDVEDVVQAVRKIQRSCAAI